MILGVGLSCIGSSRGRELEIFPGRVASAWGGGHDGGEFRENGGGATGELYAQGAALVVQLSPHGETEGKSLNLIRFSNSLKKRTFLHS